ncbi:MAG TPA: ABC transporter permease [Vicinamibacterales bacterium]
MDLIWADFKYACRNIAARPAFAAIVIATLALGLGVNAAVFALVDAVLLRPLAFRDPSRLAFVWHTLPRLSSTGTFEATPFDYDAWRALRSFSEFGMLQYGSFNLTGNGDDPERVRGSRSTASLMPMLGLQPVIGRAFTPGEDGEDGDGSAPVAILADSLWRRRYGADPSIIGRTIEVDGLPRTIVGVLPRGARPPGSSTDDFELWLPMRMTAAERANETSHNYTMIGRLADGVTSAQASAELETLAIRLAAERPSHANIGVRLVSIHEQTVRFIRPALTVAVVSVALLLLVATANASTLFLAQASNRRRELAVRVALGATRRRLLSLSIVESVLFSCLGGLAGLVLGSWTLRALIPLFAASLPRVITIGVDARAAVFILALSVLIGVVFGIVAAYRPGAHVADSLAGSSRTIGTAAAARGRTALVVAQVALAVVLLSGAGLLLNSVGRLARVKPGFDPRGLLTFRISLGGQRYQASASRVNAVTDLLTRLSESPGVQMASVTSAVPFGGLRNANGVEIEGRMRVAGEPPIIIDQRYISPTYFQTLRIPLLRGRVFTAADDGRAERVTIINRTMARRYFGDASPIDRRVKTSAGADSDIWFRIVGVVDDVRHLSLDRDPVPEMYHPVAQTAFPTLTAVVRTTGDPESIVPAARAAMRAMDPDLPLYEVLTMEQLIASSFAQTRGTMLVLLVTAALAATLAGVAIYGSIWYAVVQRTREIGIRMALGASRITVFRGIVGGAIGLAAAGAAIGVVLALAGGSLLRAMLFDTQTTDPATYAVVAAAVLTVAVAASVVPARRATRVDPITALRQE